VSSKRRLLMAGRTRYRLPLSASLTRKFDALGERFELRVIGSAPSGSATSDGVFRLVPPFRPRRLDGALFWATLPVRIARELRDFRPGGIVVQSPYEAGAALVGRRFAGVAAKLVVEVHGDWRTATRLYGSPRRSLLSPIGDRFAAAALRRADAVRTLSEFTTALVRELGVEPAAVFPAFMDLEPFLGPVEPLPEQARALFVGVLEPYKDVDGLAEAWRRAAPRLPGSTLHIVGRGSRTQVVEALVHDLPGQTVWTRELPASSVAAALDQATALVLPSRSEGLPRIVVESLCRGRPVVGMRAGGIPDAVADGVNGILVEPGDLDGFVEALVRLLADRGLAERLAATARPSAERWIASPEEYAERLRRLIDGHPRP
jgi:glycosyltransferase involved in cell wall biosynthesis